MPSIPQIQIRQTYARIGIDADLGSYDMKQPRPTFELKQPAAKIEIRSHHGEMDIDQSKAWDALGRANILEVMSRIFDQTKNVVMDAIASIVDEGNQMGDIAKNKQPMIPELAKNVTVSFPQFQYAGEASYDNVDITYTARKPDIEVTPSSIELTSHPNAPEVNYTRGKLDIYMQQYNKIEITPPALDARV
ncbi:MAG: hypothetical protein K0R67_2055 [Paenibacillus sp.]|jgi:hypothetical protein|nr:hypothetical protein [Paenibacillus sp.]